MIPGTSGGNWLFIRLMGKAVQRRGKGNITNFGLNESRVQKHTAYPPSNSSRGTVGKGEVPKRNLSGI